MIISKTPIRISFLGGSTDFPEFFNRHQGAVLGTAINKYSYINLKKTHHFFDYNYRISYSISELAESIEDIQHPSVKGCLKYLGIDDNLEITYMGDWPARTGLGSSSSFTVGLVNALKAMNGSFIEKKELAKAAIDIERNVIQENVGWQDQIWAAYGGMARIEFSNNDFVYQPVTISDKRKDVFRDHLMLFFTGIKRFSHDLQKSAIEKTKNKLNDDHLIKMNGLVDEGRKILYSGDIKDFGTVLHDSWMLKKGISEKSSNRIIDDIYAAARKHGASGGKILGAGGGGFFLVFTEPKNKDAIRNALIDFQEVDFQFEKQGSQIFCM